MRSTVQSTVAAQASRLYCGRTLWPLRLGDSMAKATLIRIRDVQRKFLVAFNQVCSK
jgi:hypothetical protein